MAPGEAFVLGDNRGNAYDSRAWFGGRGGGVPFESLRGQPRFVWLAFSSDGAVSWSRYGASLDEPHIPDSPSTPDLELGLRKCLATRPPLAETEPPPRP